MTGRVSNKQSILQGILTKMGCTQCKVEYSFCNGINFEGQYEVEL